MALPISYTTHINELPAEMIDHIMRYLPLADRKSASLVCRRWEEQAFTHHFLINTQLKLKDHSDKHLDVKRLQKSWRTYRNLEVNYGNTEFDLALHLMVLEKFGRNIEVFSCPTTFKPWQLKEVLKRMPNIRQLFVFDINVVEPDATQQEFPVLNHLVELETTEAIFEIPDFDTDRIMPSLRNLCLCRVRNVNTFMALNSTSARLKTLDVWCLGVWVPIQQLDLSQLETLSLFGSPNSENIESLRPLFMKVSMLRVLSLQVEISTSLFEDICNNCPQLTSFEFTFDKMDHLSLSALKKLTNLEILHIDEWLTYDMIDGCKPLPKVKTFYLYWNAEHHVEKRFANQLHYMLPNVEIFHLIGGEDEYMDHEFLHCIGKMFTKIRELTVAEFEFPDLHSEDSFNWIGDLMNVEQLTLRCIPLEKIGCQRGNKNIKKVTLVNLFLLVGTSLLQFSDMFPSLRLVEIDSCALITTYDVEQFRRVMPQCAINFVESKKMIVST